MAAMVGAEGCGVQVLVLCRRISPLILPRPTVISPLRGSSRRSPSSRSRSLASASRMMREMWACDRPDLPRDLRLAEPAEVAQVQHAALALVERREAVRRAAARSSLAPSRTVELTALRKRGGRGRRPRPGVPPRRPAARCPPRCRSPPRSGARPSCAASSSRLRRTLVRASWTLRGRRTVLPRSRSSRRISPSIVGIANDESFVPRAGSKRSIAWISPIAPTCTRSSSGSPQCS